MNFDALRSVPILGCLGRPHLWQNSDVKLAKLGALTLGGGILSVIVSYLPGAGPCGPSTIVGMLIMTCGFMSIPAGLIMLIIGLVVRSPKTTKSPLS